jgi:hypothetical protein
MQLWIILGVIMLVLLIALLVMMFRLKRLEQRETDYYMFFVLGITWTGAGTAIFASTRNPGLLVIGVIFTVLGLANKSKWKENRRRFSDLTPEEKRIKKLVIVVLSVMVVLGIIAYAMTQ